MSFSKLANKGFSKKKIETFVFYTFHGKMLSAAPQFVVSTHADFSFISRKT